jgi:hypothetical protein
MDGWMVNLAYFLRVIRAMYAGSLLGQPCIEIVAIWVLIACVNIYEGEIWERYILRVRVSGVQ